MAGKDHARFEVLISVHGPASRRSPSGRPARPHTPSIEGECTVVPGRIAYVLYPGDPLAPFPFLERHRTAFIGDVDLQCEHGSGALCTLAPAVTDHLPDLPCHRAGSFCM